MGIYEFAILGNTTSEQRENLTKSIEEMASEFDLCVGDHVRIYNSETVMERNRSAAFTAVYFGGSPQVDVETAQSIYNESVPIIPVVSNLELFSSHIPEFLQPTNGYCLNGQDPDMKELAALMMECVGLLRRQRRVFVSYRRTESRESKLEQQM